MFCFGVNSFRVIQNNKPVYQNITCSSMGSNLALFVANLLLFYYEWQYMNNITQRNVISTRKFCHSFKFIDHLTIMNNDNFGKNVRS